MPELLRMATCSAALLATLAAFTTGCAELPETTTVLQEDDRIMVSLETDPDAPSRTHTSQTDLSTEQLTALLRGYSVRPLSRVPIQALTDNKPPRKLFRETELDALVPPLRDALLKVGFRERVRFEVLSPGRNPRYWRDVTGGRLKVRDHYLHLSVDYFHVEQPVRKTDAYDRNHPTPWTPEQPYSVYFEPERFYVIDPALDESAVDLDMFIGRAAP